MHAVVILLLKELLLKDFDKEQVKGINKVC